MLHRLIERHWQRPIWLLTLLLWLPARLFALLAAIRRYSYRRGWKTAKRLPVPVVVVGNIHAGGTGKTPLTAALVRSLQHRGIAVGIISRGYGRSERGTHLLGKHSSAAQAGDEPLMLYRHTGAPTAVSADRHAAAQALLAANPHLQVIIADDGMQHYALARDLEIAVYPAADSHRRPDLLPNGALREPVSRLRSVDALIVSNGTTGLAAATARHFHLDTPPALFDSSLQTKAPYAFHNPQHTLDNPDTLQHARCAAIAAIARPERFFNSLRQLGIPLHETHALPDHRSIKPEQLPQADYIFITEKDAVKLDAQTTPQNVWVLPVCAIIQPDIGAWLCQRLNLTPKGHPQHGKEIS